MVQEAVTFVDALPTKESKLDLVQTLLSVTEGKVCPANCKNRPLLQKPLYSYKYAHQIE
jgi:hypothetical protein